MWGDDFSLITNKSYDILDMTIESITKTIDKMGLSDKYQLSYSSMNKYFEDVYADGKK